MTKLQSRENGNGLIIAHCDNEKKIVKFMATLTKPDGTKKLNSQFNLKQLHEYDEDYQVLALDAYTVHDPAFDEPAIFVSCLKTCQDGQCMITLFKLKVQGESLQPDIFCEFDFPMAASTMVSDAAG